MTIHVAVLLVSAAVGSPLACSTPGSCEGTARASLMQRVTSVHQSQGVVSESDSGGSNVAKLLESMQLFQEAATENSAELVAQQLAAVYKTAGTPEVARLANEMLKQLTKKRQAVVQAHNKDVSDLKSMLGRFASSASNLTAALKAAEPLEAAVVANRAQHSACRCTESSLKDDLDVASAALAAAKAYAATKLAEEAALLKSHQDLVGSITELCDTNRGPLKISMTNLIAAINAAIDAKQKVADRQAEYDAANKKHRDQRDACNKMQLAFEQSVCKVANQFDLICAHYDGEYESHVEDYKAFNQSVYQRELDRHVEVEWIDKTFCTLGLLNESSRSEDGAVHAARPNFSKCFSKVVDTDQFNIAYAATPAREPCHQVAIRPCAAGFLSQEYASLPQNARATDCSVSCELAQWPPCEVYRSRPPTECAKYRDTLPGPVLHGESFTVIGAPDFLPGFETAATRPRQWIFNLGRLGDGSNHWLFGGNRTPHPIQFGAYNGRQIGSGDIVDARTLATTWNASSRRYSLYVDGVLDGFSDRLIDDSRIEMNIKSGEMAIGINPGYRGDQDFEGCVRGVDVYRCALDDHQLLIAANFLQAEVRPRPGSFPG